MSSAKAAAATAANPGTTTAEQHRQLDESVLAVARRHSSEHGATQSDLTGSRELRSVPLEQLVQSLNRLLRAERLVAVRGAAPAAGAAVTMRYRLPTAADARTRGLGNEERMVLQRVREGGNAGVWTKDLRQRTNLSQPQVARILKALEARGLVKAVKGVAHPSRKLFMLAELEPSREITGGAWYINNEFDEDFIAQLRLVCLKYVGGLPKGGTATVADVAAFVRASGVFGVELQAEDVAVVLDTLYYDNLLDKLTAEEALAEARAHGVPLQLEVEEEMEVAKGGSKRRRQHGHHHHHHHRVRGGSSSMEEEEEDQEDEEDGGGKKADGGGGGGSSTSASSSSDEEDDEDDDDDDDEVGRGKKKRRARGAGGRGGRGSAKGGRGGGKKGRAAQPASSSGGGSEEEEEEEESRSASLGSSDGGGDDDDDDDDDDDFAPKGRKGARRKKGGLGDDDDHRRVSPSALLAGAGSSTAARYRLAAHPLPPASESAVLATPCGSCPVAHECREGAQIAPQSCAYFREWLDF
jgi:DNA-directed RNA polymerase III subunit RPC6